MAAKKYELKVVGDPNDADYITEISVVTQKELDRLVPMFKQIKKFKPYTTPCSYGTREHRHNFPYGECHRADLGEKSLQELYGWSDEDLDFLMDYIPLDEWGLHTIESVEYYDVPKKKVLI